MVEGIEPFAKTQAVELIAALLHRLSQRGPYAAGHVAQQARGYIVDRIATVVCGGLR